MQKMEGINHWLDVLKDLAPTGYAIALHIEFNAPKLMFQTYPVAWINYYEENGFFLSDPVVMWGMQNQGICRWRDLVAIDSRGVLKEAQAYGMNYGFVLSIDGNDEHSIAGFSRPDREFNDAEITEITEILRLIHNEKLSAIKINEKQKTLLNALARGVHIEDTAANLGMPVITVKSQLARVRAILGTRTSAEAVQRAADLGLLK
ncbi:MAG: autoinducer binding domain-containing protein [Rhodobacterales bacterium]